MHEWCWAYLYHLAVSWLQSLLHTAVCCRFTSCVVLQILLLSTCLKRGLKVISATGAGARADPTRIRVADIRESSNDPLSRTVRRKHVLHFVPQPHRKHELISVVVRMLANRCATD